MFINCECTTLWYLMSFTRLLTHMDTHRPWFMLIHAVKFLDRAVFIFQNGNVDPVETCDWFHANITKEDAANYLARGSNLTYLYVRLFYRIKSVVHIQCLRHARFSFELHCYHLARKVYGCNSFQCTSKKMSLVETLNDSELNVCLQYKSLNIFCFNSWTRQLARTT